MVPVYHIHYSASPVWPLYDTQHNYYTQLCACDFKNTYVTSDLCDFIVGYFNKVQSSLEVNITELLYT